jgi:endoglucanase
VSRPARRIVVSAVAGAVALTAAGFALYGPAASAGSLPAATPFYTDPNSQAARWVAANPNDSRAAAIKSRIAQTPSGIWFANFTPSTVASSVRSLVSSTGGKTPVLAIYQIPNRDCGGASAGGAQDISSYKGYIDNFASGLGSAPVVIILEPDSVALTTCLNSSQLADRNSGLSYAVTKLKSADPNAKVYMDAGHSAWNSASEQANRLTAAGVLNSDGIFSNVSNFNPTSNEVNFDKAVLAALGNRSNLHAVVDTSRNGNGSNGQWCDPSGRGLGLNPTANTGDSAIDAYLWVKPPGEADGCAAAAGTFVPDLAYALIQNSPIHPSATVTESPSPSRSSASPSPSRSSASPSPSSASPSPSPSSASPSPSPSVSSASPTPTAGTEACRVSYVKQSEWAGGFVAQVTVTNLSSTSISGWTLKFSFPGDQRITSAWSATVTQSGTAVTATNLSWNGALAPGGNANFGFQGTWNSNDSSPTSFTLNGATCV